MAGPFVFDILSAIPFREIVAGFGSGDHKYATWLQLPRMFACWRLVAVVQKLQVRDFWSAVFQEVVNFRLPCYG